MSSQTEPTVLSEGLDLVLDSIKQDDDWGLVFTFIIGKRLSNEEV